MSSLVAAAVKARRTHVFAEPFTCVCGVGLQDLVGWERHRVAVGLEQTARWLSSRGYVDAAALINAEVRADVKEQER